MAILPLWETTTKYTKDTKGISAAETGLGFEVFSFRVFGVFRG
jgi:hypothetical protein